jgi:hypothetical protein
VSTYYVRQTGLDSNAGTSAGAAWATIGKALGASGIASGDTVYIGAGVYREAVTVNMTSATAETFVIGDTDGSHTGDPGLVRLTGNSDDRNLSILGSALSLNGRDFLTFQNIMMDVMGSPPLYLAVLTSTNLKFINCTVVGGGLAGYGIQARVDAPVTWLFDSCTIVCWNGAPFTLQVDLNASADYDMGITFKNCLFSNISGTTNAAVRMTAGGSGAFKGGGVSLYNCLVLSASTGIETASASFSSTFPLKVYNCIVSSAGTGLKAFTAGQIVQDYNLITAVTVLSNVATAPHSRSSTGQSAYLADIEFGQSQRAGLRPRPWFSPGDLSPLLGYGNQSGSPSVDTFGHPRPSGGARLLDSGTATSGAAGTITDSGKAWRVNAFTGRTVKIKSGTGSGQTKHIKTNTATALTVSGNWVTNPDSTSVYEIYEGCQSTTGKATSGTAGTAYTNPQNPILDNFNRADGALTAPWVQAFGTMSIVINQASATSATAFYDVVYGADQEVFATIATLPASPGNFSLVMKSSGVSTNSTYIFIQYDLTSPGSILVYSFNGASSTLRGTISYTIVAGDVLGARCTAAGLVQVYVNGTAQGSAVDITAWPQYADPGRLGMSLNGAAARIDNFGGGTVLPGGAALTDTGAAWGTLLWNGYTIDITGGTGSGQSRTIQSHTATVVTISTAWATVPDSTSTYKIYQGSDLVVLPGIGPMERGNTARKETIITDAGGVAIACYGPWVHDFKIPVDATSTTITIKSQFDAAYGSGTKPTMSVVNGTECGVANATSTSTQTAGNWYTHSLTFTPTAKGIVTVRLAASGQVDSKTAFDTFTKS